MKAAKPILVVACLIALAAAGYTMLTRQGAPNILVTTATAAPIEGEADAVGIFASIDNAGGPDRLLRVTSGAAQSTTLAPDGPLAIPAHSSVSLAPDGAFVRLSGDLGDLGEGRVIPVTLHFEQAGAVATRARVVAPRPKGAADQFGLFGIGDICRVGEGEPAPRIAVSVRADGAGWIVDVAAEEFTFERDLADGLHIAGTGHGHLYLNGLKLGRLYEPSARIGALPPGRHQISVTLNTNDHRAYVVDDLPVRASAMIEVR